MGKDEKKQNNSSYIASKEHFVFIRKPLTFNYNPQEDITAYELAKLLPYLLGQSIFEDEWEKFDPNLKRHLGVVKR